MGVNEMKKLRQFVLPGVVAKILSAVAYRRTEISQATVGHKHRFYSFYLTEALAISTDSGRTIEPSHFHKLILWTVPPGTFHEWIGSGTVWDLTPLHRQHKLV
jgi:hypothetical protein